MVHPRRRQHQAVLKDRVDRLTELSLFCEQRTHELLIRADKLQRLAGEMVLRKFEAGDKPCRGGTLGDTMFLLMKGTVRVGGVDGKGDAIAKSIISAPDYFGEVAFRKGIARTSDITAQQSCECLEVSREAYLRIVGKHLG